MTLSLSKRKECECLTTFSQVARTSLFHVGMHRQTAIFPDTLPLTLQSVEMSPGF